MIHKIKIMRETAADGKLEEQIIEYYTAEPSVPGEFVSTRFLIDSSNHLIAVDGNGEIQVLVNMGNEVTTVTVNNNLILDTRKQ